MKKKISIQMIGLVGYLSILGNSIESFSDRFPLMMTVATLCMIGIYIYDRDRKPGFVKYLIPFSGGLLSLPMRLFYIDRFDYAARLDHLIGLILLFSILWILYREKGLQRVLSRFNGYSMKRRILTLFIIFELIFILSAAILVKKGVILIGDEPHYLAISHSIAKDGDINVFNQYARDEYRDFIDYRLKSHAKVGKGFKKWYSIHLPGLSLTLAPFLLLKIPFELLYFLIRSFLGLWGAGIGILIYLFSVKLTKRQDWPLFLSLIYIMSAPVFFMTIHVFAEIQATFFLLLSLYLALFRREGRVRIRLFLSGLFMALTIFWGMKYLLFLGLYLFGFSVYFLYQRDIRSIILMAAMPLLSIMAFAAFLYYAYGSFSPMGVYYGVMSAAERAEIKENTEMIPLSLRIETLLDYFFDQRAGLLLYNPLYLFFFPGLVLALKRFRHYGLMLLLSIPPALYLLYHGYSTVRAGYCPQARYLTPISWVFLLFTIIYFIESRNRFLKKLMPFIPVYAFMVVFFQLAHPFTLYQQTTHDSPTRAGLMFQKLSNLYIDIPPLLPSFAKVEGNFYYLPNLVLFILFILFMVFALSKVRRFPLKTIGISAFLIMFLLLACFPNYPLYHPIKVYDKANRNAVPFFFYGNRLPSGRVFSEGFSQVSSSGETSFYLTIPRSYYLKHRKHLARGITGNIRLKNLAALGEYKIFNFNTRLSTSAQKSGNDWVIKLENIQYKMVRSRIFIMIRLRINEPVSLKPTECLLKLFSVNDRLSS